MIDKIKKKLKTFFDNVSDLSWGEIITLKALRFMYWLEVALGGALAAVTVVLGFRESIILGLLAAVVSPFLLMIYVIILRIIFEILSVVFRVSSFLKKVSNFSPEDFREEDGRIHIEEYEVEEDDEKDGDDEN